MPSVEIDTPGVTIRLTANEVSVEALGVQAMNMFKEASGVEQKTHLSGSAVGFTQENRSIYEPDAR